MLEAGSMQIFRLVPLLLALVLVPASVRAQAPTESRSAEPLTLSEILAEARAHSPALHAAAARVDARRALERAAGLPPDPAVRIGAMNVSVPEFSADMPTSMVPSVEVMQMLPVGKLGLARRSAEQATAIAAADAEELWWEVRGRAAMAFYDVWRTDRQVAVLRESLTLLESFAAIARSMYAAGDASQSDVLRATVEVARMHADIVRMEAMRATAAAQLNAALGRSSAMAVPALAADVAPRPLPSADTLRAWAEQYRPMLARGRTELARAATELDRARREIWPDLSVGVQYGQRPGGSEMTPSSGTERMASLMVGFTLPVYARQRQLQMRTEARAMQAMAGADLSQMRADIDARIAELVSVIVRSRTLLELYETRILPQAGANVESAMSSYRVGAVDFMTLVDAQMARNGFEQELAALQAEYGIAVAELEMTIGRELPPATVDGGE